MPQRLVVDDGQDGIRGNRGIDGAAARPQDAQAGGRGQVVGRHDRGVAAPDQRRGNERSSVHEPVEATRRTAPRPRAAL